MPFLNSSVHEVKSRLVEIEGLIEKTLSINTIASSLHHHCHDQLVFTSRHHYHDNNDYQSQTSSPVPAQIDHLCKGADRTRQGEIERALSDGADVNAILKKCHHHHRCHHHHHHDHHHHRCHRHHHHLHCHIAKTNSASMIFTSWLFIWWGELV